MSKAVVKFNLIRKMSSFWLLKSNKIEHLLLLVYYIWQQACSTDILSNGDMFVLINLKQFLFSTLMILIPFLPHPSFLPALLMQFFFFKKEYNIIMLFSLYLSSLQSLPYILFQIYDIINCCLYVCAYIMSYTKAQLAQNVYYYWYVFIVDH